MQSAAGEYNDGPDESIDIDMSKDFNDIPDADDENPDQDSFEQQNQPKNFLTKDFSISRHERNKNVFTLEQTGENQESGNEILTTGNN